MPLHWKLKRQYERKQESLSYFLAECYECMHLHNMKIEISIIFIILQLLWNSEKLRSKILMYLILKCTHFNSLNFWIFVLTYRIFSVHEFINFLIFNKRCVQEFFIFIIFNNKIIPTSENDKIITFNLFRKLTINYFP